MNKAFKRQAEVLVGSHSNMPSDDRNNHDNSHDDNRDRFAAGPTREQIEKADEFLKGRDLPTFLEKRDLAEDYRSARLKHPELKDQINVYFATHPVEGKDFHVVLSHQDLPAAAGVEIEWPRPGRTETFHGVLEPWHPGQRAEDCKDGPPIMVNRFYPD